ncbi:protein kinase domain-containing protein [Penicillium malachiteum]|uniref:protein kinase domain-containing protein n=1 Tax=Penicillium malachiteum TaxID=1324776 RepID=UPI0025493F49|nr:protein kinase domain-containing protein [Penicillium malachiteum]KAJ5720263.1 protein kinase domain-containing protein [Penicillium malachiteum]
MASPKYKCRRSSLEGYLCWKDVDGDIVMMEHWLLKLTLGSRSICLVLMEKFDKVPRLERGTSPFQPSATLQSKKTKLFPQRMSETINPTVPPELEFNAYCEDRDFRAQGKHEPNSRSQTVIHRSHNKKWWIKITLNGAIPSSENIRPAQPKSKRERRNELQDFVTMIDFQSLVLLDDTVTELILNEDTGKIDTANRCLQLPFINQPIWLIRNIRYHIREDPLRAEITNGVFRVDHKGDRTLYILKVVNRHFYYPQDTVVIQQELENLKQFREARGIVQPAGIIVFTNPYTTYQKSNQQMAINSILLEFYSGGSLQYVLKEQFFKDSRWKDWAIQIGNALDTIHRAKKTHMDLKPSNIVIDKHGTAILIDISGIDEVTYEWQSPEIRDEISPFDLPFHTRQSNDIRAYRKILEEIASKVEEYAFTNTPTMVARHLTEDVTTRWTLSQAIFQLSTCHHGD